MRTKIQTSFTLSKEAMELIAALAKKLGISKTGALEIAIRKLAEKEKVRIIKTGKL